MKDAPLLHRAEYALYRLAGALVRTLPHRAARGLGRALGVLVWGTLSQRRRIARRNLELALPELSAAERRRTARASCLHMVEAATDLISSRRFDAVELCRRLTIEGWDDLQRAEADARGVILMSAHLGMWEVAGLAVGLYRGSIHVVGRPLDNPHLEAELQRFRTRFGNRTISKRGAARGVLRVLREDGRPAILIDQRVRPEEGIRVPFFGRAAVTSPLPARLSRRTGAPVVPVYGFGEAGGRYRVVVRPAIRATPEDTETTLTERYLAAVESEIRARPELWLWMHERWKGEGEA